MAIDSKYGWQIRRGLVREKGLFKFGFNPTVGTELATIWSQGGLYSYLTSASILKISSSNTNDTSEGTGARTVQLRGLDANYDEVTETVILNGQTAVNTNNQFIRINRMIVLSAGTGGANAGVIYAGTGTVTTGVPENKYATIAIGDNQTLMALWTVPRNHTAYIYTLQLSTGSSSTNKFVTGRLTIREFGGTFAIKYITSFANTKIYVDLPIPIVAGEKSDIELRAITSSQTDGVSGDITIIYMDEEYVSQ